MSDYPPIRTHAVVVVVTVVVVDVAVRRNAKKNTTHSLCELFVCFAPGNSHMLDITHHAAPVIRLFDRNIVQLHRKLNVIQEHIAVIYCLCYCLAAFCFILSSDAVCFKELVVDIQASFVDFINN